MLASIIFYDRYHSVDANLSYVSLFSGRTLRPRGDDIAKFSNVESMVLTTCMLISLFKSITFGKRSFLSQWESTKRDFKTRLCKNRLKWATWMTLFLWHEIRTRILATGRLACYSLTMELPFAVRISSYHIDQWKFIILSPPDGCGIVTMF